MHQTRLFRTIAGILVVTLALVRPSAGQGSDAFPYFTTYSGRAYDVSYNARSLLLNGEPALFLSGSVHLARVPRAEWKTTFAHMRDAGLNMMETYGTFISIAHDGSTAAAMLDNVCLSPCDFAPVHLRAAYKERRATRSLYQPCRRGASRALREEILEPWMNSAFLQLSSCVRVRAATRQFA